MLHSDAVIRGIVVQKQLEPELPNILGDRIQLQQVLLNLLLNAFDAMRDGLSRDRVVSVRSRHVDSEVLVTVSDRGPGIPPEDMDRLFEPFRSTKPGGLGMGLSISRSIVASHGGRHVGREQCRARGDLRFQPPRRTSKIDAELSAMSSMNERTYTVFVVDDDFSVRKSVVRLLKSMGYPARPYGSASEFLDDWRNDPAPGCLVLDVQLPGLNGLELQETLRGAACPISIIFITGHGDIPMSVRAMKAGAVDFLAKPFQDEDLLRAVREAIDRDQERQAEFAEREAIAERYATLTPREREVMALVVAGLPNKRIATELGTSEKTIKVHRGRVMEKMQVESVADLVRASQKLDLGPRVAVAMSDASCLHVSVAGRRHGTKVQCAKRLARRKVDGVPNITPCDALYQGRQQSMPECRPLIAIVDDDPSVRRAVERLVRSFGLQAESFQSGEGLLRALADSRRFGCAVLDVQMPGMSGLEVQRRVVHLGIELPLVFITAHESETIAELAMAAGAVGFLQKPFSDESLIELIRRALRP